MSSIIGVVVTIIIAIIASRSGKVKVKPHHNPTHPPKDSALPELDEIWRTLTMPKIPVPSVPESLETLQPEEMPLETATSNYESSDMLKGVIDMTTLETTIQQQQQQKQPHLQHELPRTQQNIEPEHYALDIEGRKMIIYSELLKPKYTEY